MTRHEFANLRGETFIGFLAGIGVAHALNAKLAWVRTAGGFHAMIETDIEGDLAQAVFDGLPRALPILKGADGSRVSLLRHAMADDFHRALLDESDERAKSFHAAVAASTPRVKQKIKMDTDETAAKKTIKERKARKNTTPSWLKTQKKFRCSLPRRNNAMRRPTHYSRTLLA